MSMHRKIPGTNGFTLIEVMVALLVVAISLFAIFNTTSSVTWHASYLKEKTMANWIAQNQIALYRSKKTWSSVSNTSGQVEMADTEWDWKMHVSKTDNPNVRKIDVEVFLDGGDTIKGSATGYIAKI